MTQTSYPSDQTTTLAQYLFEEQHKHDLGPKLCLLIEHMARQCQAIGQRVRQGSLGGVLGSMGAENVQGEVQQKLDLIANDMLLQDNDRSEEHTSELQSRGHLVCRLLLE